MAPKTMVITNIEFLTIRYVMAQDYYDVVQAMRDIVSDRAFKELATKANNELGEANKDLYNACNRDIDLFNTFVEAFGPRYRLALDSVIAKGFWLKVNPK